MKNAVAALCAILLLSLVATGTRATGVAPMPPTSGAPTEPRLVLALREIVAATQQKGVDEKALVVRTRQILDDPEFAQLDERWQHAVYLIHAALLVDLGDLTGADTYIRKANAMASTAYVDWQLRARISLQREDYDDAMAALSTLATQFPDKLNGLSDQAILMLARRSALKGDGLLHALYYAGWKPTNQFFSADDLWASLVAYRVDKGDLVTALAVAQSIHDPSIILEMRADKRFDVVASSVPGHFDVMAAFDAYLADVKARAAMAPDKLAGVNALARLLLKMRRPKEALDLIDAALARLADKPDAFSDADEQLGWMKNQRGDALIELGRDAEGIAVFEEAAQHNERGAVNVSQAINLAELYAMHDRPKDALAAVAALTLANASPYGRMALQDARACPYAMLGDKEGLASALAYMKAHMSDAPTLYLRTLSCVGDADALAVQVIARLEDLLTRTDMLAALQNYRTAEHATARQAQIRALWEDLRKRPDVKAAVDRVGRIESYDLAGGY